MIEQKINSIGIIGSFTKQMLDIKSAKSTFEKFGLIVTVPKTTDISQERSMSDYLILQSDVSNRPSELEREYLESLLNSDLVYCCNSNGYIGKTVMFEIGFLWAKNKTVIFQEKPQDALILDFLTGENGNINYISSVEKLFKHIHDFPNLLCEDNKIV
jgi:hypothetical protein